MKYRLFVLLLAGLLLLCGCKEVNTPDDTTVSLQGTTALLETTVPQETAEPTETTQATKPPFPPETQPATVPTDPPADTQLITVTEEAPLYDTEQSWLLVTPGANNEYFKSTYIHLPGFAAIDDRHAYDGKYVFVNTEEWPMLRGNHHEAYLLYDAWMEKLENQHFSYAWEFFGCETILEFDYVIHGDDVIITYYPHEANYVGNGPNRSYGLVVDTSRGRNALLIRFYLFPDENDVDNQLWYYATLDLETGKLNYFLSQFDRSVFKGGMDLLEWLPDGDLLLTDNSDKLTYLDIHRTQIHKIDLETDDPLYYCGSDEDGVVFAAETGRRNYGINSSYWPHYYQYQFYRYSFEDGSITKLLEGGWFSHSREPFFVTYEDDEHNYHVHDLLTGQDTLLHEARGIVTFSDSFVVYRNGANKDYLYDAVSGETVLLDVPAGYGNVYYPSPDGRKLLTFCNWERDYSLLIYDCDSKTFLEIQRTNPNPLGEQLPFWAAEDKMLLYCHNGNMHQDIVVFEFK